MTEILLAQGILEDMLEKAQEGGSGLQMYREGIFYLPPFFATQPGEGGNGKVVMRSTTPEALRSAPELNPFHLTQQGIQSTVDSVAQNIVYTLPDGEEVRIGLYDRSRAAEANALAQAGNGSTIADFINGKDPLLPKIRLLDVQPEAITGGSYPQMFTYRSAVFDDTTPYGIVVGVDRRLVGEPETLEGVVLDPEFIRSHATDMNFLFGPVIQAARQQGLDLSDLTLADALSAPDAMKGIYSFMAKGRHSVTLSYTRTPHVVVTGRLNGIPLSSSFQREGEKLYCFEMASPTGETPEGYIATIPHALVRNQKNPEDSAIGDLVYTAISRDESRELAQENPDFGVLELQVVRGYELSNLQVEFKQVEAPVEFRFPDAGETMTRSFGTKSYGGGGYTAGVTALQNVRKATITAKPFEIERVLLRDALCLVHKERGPAETYGTAHVAEMGPAN